MKEMKSDRLIISDLQFVFRGLFCISEMNMNCCNASLYKLAPYVTYYFTMLCRSRLLPLSQQSPVSGLETVNYPQGRRCVQHFLIEACYEGRSNTEQHQKRPQLETWGCDSHYVKWGIWEKKPSGCFLFQATEIQRKKPTDKEKRAWMEKEGWKLVLQVIQLSGNLQKPNRGKYIWVLGCDCIGRQQLEQAKVIAAVWEDFKGDITCRGDEVQGPVRSRGQQGVGRKSQNVGAARRGTVHSPFGRYS